MPRKCKHCKKVFEPTYNTTQQTCTIPCAIAWGKLKTQQKADKAHREKKREFKKNDKQAQRDAADRAFNAFIRYRDRNDPCISCDRPANWAGQWAAGHYHTKGARSDLRYNENNVHKQCNRYCNSGKSGNIEAYRPRLIAKIGIDKINELAEVKRARYLAEDYRAIAKEYRDKLKHLKSISTTN